MLKRLLLLVSLLVALSITTPAQEMTARDYAQAHGLRRGDFRHLTPSVPHACTLSRQHRCIYYGGDIDPSDPQENGLSNENTVFLPESRTFSEINVPVSIKISAAFTNNLQTYGVIDPQTATWEFRMGVEEGNGGTLIAYGISPALLTDTGRNAFGLEEYELVTRTPVTLPAGDVWFDVMPNCTDENNPDCTNGRYFESDTDGLNGLNTNFTVTSNDGLGPMYAPELFFGGWYSWCNDDGAACGDGTSTGLLK